MFLAKKGQNSYNILYYVEPMYTIGFLLNNLFFQVAALITSRSINLKWQPRGSDAAEVTKYIVEYMEHDRQWQEITISDPPQYNALIENLKPATVYYFRVIAEGQAGQSSPSQEVIENLFAFFTFVDNKRLNK